MDTLETFTVLKKKCLDKWELYGEYSIVGDKDVPSKSLNKINNDKDQPKQIIYHNNPYKVKLNKTL